MKYVLAHAVTAIVITAFWAAVIIFGSQVVVGMFESRDIGIIACFVFGLIIGGPLVGSYFILHGVVDDAVFEHELKK